MAITVTLIRPIRTVVISIAHQFVSYTVTAIPAVELTWWAAIVWIFIWPVGSNSWELQTKTACNKVYRNIFLCETEKNVLHKLTSFCILMCWLRVMIMVNMCQQQNVKLIGSECWFPLLISRQHVTVCNFQSCYRAYLYKHVNNNGLFT